MLQIILPKTTLQYHGESKAVTSPWRDIKGKKEIATNTLLTNVPKKDKR